MQNERIQYLDRIKGFTILLVVIAHVYIFSYGMTDTLVFKTIASFHMHLFMFVSGYVAYIPPPIKRIQQKRLLNVYARMFSRHMLLV